MEESKSGQTQIQVKATDQVLHGVYSNMVQVSHTSEEFVMDFLTVVPPNGTLTARVIVSPSHAKRLMKTLQEKIDNYEKQFGTISLAVVPDSGFKNE